VPSSFSRFLSEEEMLRVREIYLQSLEDTDAGADDQPASGAPTTVPPSATPADPSDT